MRLLADGKRALIGVFGLLVLTLLGIDSSQQAKILSNDRVLGRERLFAGRQGLYEQLQRLSILALLYLQLRQIECGQ